MNDQWTEAEEREIELDLLACDIQRAETQFRELAHDGHPNARALLKAAVHLRCALMELELSERKVAS